MVEKEPIKFWEQKYSIYFVLNVNIFETKRFREKFEKSFFEENKINYNFHSIKFFEKCTVREIFKRMYKICLKRTCNVDYSIIVRRLSPRKWPGVDTLRYDTPDPYRIAKLAPISVLELK